MTTSSHVPWSVRGAFFFAFISTAAATSVSSLVSVELGGSIILPCPSHVDSHGDVTDTGNSTFNTCLLRPSRPGTWAMTAFVDALDRNITGKRFNSTHCECVLPPADAEAPVDILFASSRSALGETEYVLGGTVQYVPLWTTAFSLRPFLSTDETGGLVVGTHEMFEEKLLGDAGDTNISRSIKETEKKVAPRYSLKVSLRIDPFSDDGGEAGGGAGEGEDAEMILHNFPIQPGVKSVIPFSLEKIPEDIQLLPMLVFLKVEDHSPQEQDSQKQLHDKKTFTLHRKLFLSRVLTPKSSYPGSLVQIDYSRKAVLVNNEILAGNGFYDVQTISLQNFTRQSIGEKDKKGAGLSWNMRYFKSNDPAPGNSPNRKDNKFILDYMDWAWSAKVYVMFDIFFPVEFLFKDYENFEVYWGGGKSNNTNVTDTNDTTSTNTNKPVSGIGNIVEQINLVKNHPALLGYYICDDCTTQYLEVWEQLVKNNKGVKNKKGVNDIPNLNDIYQRIKKIDPYHPLIGAEEAANVYTFTTGNGRISPTSEGNFPTISGTPSIASSITSSTASFGPSLDLVMVENYVDTLAKNAYSNQVLYPGMDGTLGQWPLTYEPVINCPGEKWVLPDSVVEPDGVVVSRNLRGGDDLGEVGIVSDAENQNVVNTNAINANTVSKTPIEERALVLYGLHWLSSILANIHLQLVFVLYAFDEIIADGTLNDHEYMLYEGTGRYSRVVNGLKNYLFARVSGLKEPSIQAKMVGDGENSNSSALEVRPQKSSVEANGVCTVCGRLWRRDVSTFCGLLVLVNTQNHTTSIEIRLKNAERWGRDAMDGGLERIDALDDKNEKVAFQNGILKLTLAKFETQVWRTDRVECGAVGGSGVERVDSDSLMEVGGDKQEEVVWM